jgi:hypothetical protein
MDGRVSDALTHHRDTSRLLEDFLNGPGRAGLKPYRRELDVLVRDHGMTPIEAAQFISGIDEKHHTASARKAAAARDVRNRSAVEVGGDANGTSDPDRDFERAMRKAKSIDDMFSVLQRY